MCWCLSSQPNNHFVIIAHMHLIKHLLCMDQKWKQQPFLLSLHFTRRIWMCSTYLESSRRQVLMMRDWLSIILNVSPFCCIETSHLPFIKLWVITRLVLDFYLIQYLWKAWHLDFSFFDTFPISSLNVGQSWN